MTNIKFEIYHYICNTHKLSLALSLLLSPPSSPTYFLLNLPRFFGQFLQAIIVMKVHPFYKRILKQEIIVTKYLVNKCCIFCPAFGCCALLVKLLAYSLIIKDMSGFTSNTLLIRNFNMLSV